MMVHEGRESQKEASSLAISHCLYMASPGVQVGVFFFRERASDLIHGGILSNMILRTSCKIHIVVN